MKRRLYEKRKEDHDKVLKYIEENYSDGLISKLPDTEGILHGYEVSDPSSGEHLTIGWDYVLNRVMYIRTCQPLMFDAHVGKVEEDY